MKLEMPTFGKNLKKSINRFEFEVGIIPDTAHYEPQHTPLGQTPPTSTYAGGPVRKASRVKSELSTGEIFIENMKRLNVDLLRAPFKEKSNKDIVKFTREFLKMALSKGSLGRKRVINLLQAIVRNPILRQEYGPNGSGTADAKGFDRHLFDTGKMFKSIKAVISKDRRR